MVSFYHIHEKKNPYWLMNMSSYKYELPSHGSIPYYMYSAAFLVDINQGSNACLSLFTYGI
ncbi:hypothetical protein Hdeb2414_s0005g00169881 [Helianthus debilis subsp. tardiflorus]